MVYNFNIIGRGYIEDIFSRHIKNTPKGCVVRDMTIKLCTLTNQVKHDLKLPTGNVHITTKVIKKNYDKRPAVENDYILHNGWKIIHNPDDIYKNKDAKRGDFAFTKTMDNNVYLASIEISTYADEPILYVVSMFRLSKPEQYLRGYEHLWSWKGGNPSS